MSSRIIKYVEGRGMPFGESDVDTDIIAPSRFLLTITWEGVGEGLLYPRRFGFDGKPIDSSPLNNHAYAGAKILFAGNNFGCGSSREHAPQAIKANYDAVVAVGFAGIFDGNCYAIGLPAMRVSAESMTKLLEINRAAPQTNFGIDLERMTISGDGFSEEIMLDDVKRTGFLNGTWDVRQMLVDNLDKARKVAESLPYISGF